MNERRPTPEEPLSLVREEESHRGRGQLTIFFGAAPGVGKTYSMLEAARAARTEGKDVVVGIVETHGRYDTASLVLGLELLPRWNAKYRGVILEELDLNGALIRRPTLLLVDELAHRNAEGSRHAKRWQDVEELLSAGIDVYTTLNVHHLDSLNDVVAQITGVRVPETVPDAIVERADEVRLIDLPPDELLVRLRDGKVYLQAQAAHATQHFFRKGNLIALRELALRCTAERVDAQMHAYRREHGIEQAWATTERIVVCVSPSPDSERLVRAAKRLAASLHAPLLAVFLERTTGLSAHDQERVNHNLRLAEQLGADTSTLTGDDPIEQLLAYAKSRNVTKIVVGKTTHPRWRNVLRRDFLGELVRQSGDIDIYVITGDGHDSSTITAFRNKKPRWSTRAYVASIGSVAIATAVAIAFFGRSQLADVVMLYLLAIVLVAMRYGYGPSMLAAVLSVVSFDFFFIAPYYSFAVSDFRHVLTFCVMFFVAALISGLTERVRRQAEAATDRERRAASLFSLSRDLASARSIDELIATAADQMRDVFDCATALFLPDASGAISASGTFIPNEKESGVAEWVWLRERAAGLGTETLPAAKALYIPLRAARGRIGVLGVLPADSDRFVEPSARQLLETFGNQIALAIERSLLVETAKRTQVQVEAEQLRNSLLSSVSHDLRTPLAVVKGAGSALVFGNDTLSPADRLEYAESIVNEADRLNRLVRNLLDMTRLDAGVMQVNKEWQSIEEIVGTALGRLDDRLRQRKITTGLPPKLPLIPCDALLIEQVLINLVENAARYTPEGTAIELSARLGDGAIEVEVADRGPGIPQDQVDRIFEKFHRGREGHGGIGLGLAVCRGIVTAHGGRIWAAAREGGGASFRFTIPVEGVPPTVNDLDDAPPSSVPRAP